MEREQQKADFILSNAVLVFVRLFFFPMHPLGMTLVVVRVMMT